MLYLDVNYEEKDEVKGLGARWDPQMKKWYVEKQFNYPKFAKWILNGKEDVNIICDHVYLVVGQRVCYKCRKRIPVITFAVEKYCNIWDRRAFKGSDFYNWYNDGEIHMTSDMPEISDDFRRYIDKNYNYHLGYSKTAGTSYMANHCPECNSIQGDFYLNQEVDSPFFIDSKEKAKALDLYKIELPYDKVMDLGIDESSSDWMIKEYANIRKLTFSRI